MIGYSAAVDMGRAPNAAINWLATTVRELIEKVDKLEKECALGKAMDKPLQLVQRPRVLRLDEHINWNEAQETGKWNAAAPIFQHSGVEGPQVQEDIVHASAPAQKRRVSFGGVEERAISPRGRRRPTAERIVSVPVPLIEAKDVAGVPAPAMPKEMQHDPAATTTTSSMRVPSGMSQHCPQERVQQGAADQTVTSVPMTLVKHVADLPAPVTQKDVLHSLRLEGEADEAEEREEEEGEAEAFDMDGLDWDDIMERYSEVETLPAQPCEKTHGMKKEEPDWLGCLASSDPRDSGKHDWRLPTRLPRHGFTKPLSECDSRMRRFVDGLDSIDQELHKEWQILFHQWVHAADTLHWLEAKLDTLTYKIQRTTDPTSKEKWRRSFARKQLQWEVLASVCNEPAANTRDNIFTIPSS